MSKNYSVHNSGCKHGVVPDGQPYRISLVWFVVHCVSHIGLTTDSMVGAGQGAGSREQRAGSREEGGGRREQG